MLDGQNIPYIASIVGFRHGQRSVTTAPRHLCRWKIDFRSDGIWLFRRFTCGTDPGHAVDQANVGWPKHLTPCESSVGACNYMSCWSVLEERLSGGGRLTSRNNSPTTWVVIQETSSVSSDGPRMLHPILDYSWPGGRFTVLPCPATWGPKSMASVNEHLDDFVDFTKSGFIWLLGAISLLSSPSRRRWVYHGYGILQRHGWKSSYHRRRRLSSNVDSSPLPHISDPSSNPDTANEDSERSFRVVKAMVKTRWQSCQSQDSRRIEASSGIVDWKEKTSQASQRSLVFLAN